MYIWKYPLPPIFLCDEFEIELPKDYHILCVQVQNDIPCIWITTSGTECYEKHNFTIIGTGNHFNKERLVYIGTFQISPFVWHLFERI